MSQLFVALAGRSEHTFKVGDVEFEAAPLTIMEAGEYFALQARENGAFDARCEHLALKLRQRCRTKVDPASITTEWLMERLDIPTLQVLEHVLLYGEMPGSGEKKA
ncbi:hypothetical protein [Deinococcus apachensis]|uniref:hypothetical protein n=1 Tax=Deinococcus apachensis TaxID=309886 RepID=UPI0003788A28|nr:hypothetical protein [Deinococcus apachensis]